MEWEKGSQNLGRIISKKRFVDLVEKYLGIPFHNVGDNYGFSEGTSSYNSRFFREYKGKEINDFIHFRSENVRIVVLEPETLTPIYEPGRIGFLKVISPFGISSYPGLSLLTPDLVEIVDVENNDILSFRVIGRAKKSEIKGCGVKFGKD